MQAGRLGVVHWKVVPSVSGVLGMIPRNIHTLVSEWDGHKKW